MMAYLRRYLSLVTLGGSLCMVYIATVNSPVFTAFVRDLGATEFHIGLIGGLPLAMLLFQFVGALLANRLVRRKPVFLVLIIIGRLVYLPIALLPLLMPDSDHLITLVIVMVAVSAALSNVIGPAWFSWMADIIPKSILNRYWAGRHMVMQLTWLAVTFAVAAFVWIAEIDVRLSFLILASVGVTAGVVDILLFIWVPEPPNEVIKGEPIISTLAAPLKDPDFRTFVYFQCAWAFCGMFGASFMMLYAIEGLQLGEGRTTLVWCCPVLNALMAPYWGRLADRHGHKSILAICTSMKPVIVLAFALVTPQLAFPVLAIVLLFDSIWNAGLFVATNGYMLKMSPQRNRTVFVASITGLSGIFGGLGAICGGAFLHATDGFHMELMGRAWNNFQLLFVLDFFMRIACAFLVYRVKEAESSDHDIVLNEVRGLWPMRFILFPVGFYRNRVLPALKSPSNNENVQKDDMKGKK